MDNVMAFLWDIRFLIVVLVAGVGYGVLEWTNTKSTLYALMLQAKSLAKDLVLNSGQEQEDWVLQKAKLFLPRKVLIFLPDDKLRSVIKYLFDLAKDYLDDGKINNSTKET